MKTYVLTVSRVFPCTHKRKGDLTFFPEKIMKTLGLYDFHRPENIDNKIHTIRANYELWAKRIEQIQKGEAILSIRYWSGKPYNSKQVEICQLDNDSGIGVQKIAFISEYWINPVLVDENNMCTGLMVKELSKNDGLSLEDFEQWFKGYDLSKPMAIIHFTKFRY